MRPENTIRYHLFLVYSGMKQRCRNPNHHKFHRYGGRGIKICESWSRFQPFYLWASSHGYQHGLLIDRIDNDGNYEPSNCRFVTPKESAQNRDHYTKARAEMHKTLPTLSCVPVMRSDGQIFPSITNAAAPLGVSMKAVSNAIRKGTKCCGFTFQYVPKEAAAS